MKIRDLKFKGFLMWPPEWVLVSDLQAGEEGVLQDVKLRHGPPRLISIEANHLGDCRKGVMIQEDSAHLELVFDKLRENLGRPLTEIGNLEIDFTPPLQKYGLKQTRPKSTARNIKRVVNKK